MSSQKDFLASRRRLLRYVTGASAAGALAGGLPGKALATIDITSDEGWQEIVSKPSSLPPERRLHLINAHTWEKLDIAYVTRNQYIDESLDSVAHLMRDHRVNRQRPMDLDLLDILFQVQQTIGIDEPMHVLSGYRTPETNAALRKRSNGVARYSLHMEGKAADIHVPGVNTRDLQQAALELKAGGVGYYGKSGFVHVDTGRVRSWGG